MLRALLVILAILSAVLGVALGLWYLYVLAVLLIAAAAGAWMLGLKGKFDIGRPEAGEYRPAEEEDLDALGILEIKPRETSSRAATMAREPEARPVMGSARASSRKAQQYSIFESEERLSSVETRVGEAVSVDKNGTTVNEVAEAKEVSYGTGRNEVRERAASRYQVISSSGGIEGDVVLPYIESLCSALGANTVCLLGSEAGGKGHRIHAIVSRNAYARSGGDLTTGNGIRWSTSRYATVERAADATWDPYDLQYYREAIAVKELAHVAVPTAKGERRFLLIADSMQDGVLVDSNATSLFEQYATLMGTLLARQEKPEEQAEATFRPRRDIIAEEMDNARSRKVPLALALVMMNRAEELAANHGQVVDELEALLRSRLERSSKDLRVERFGDLMFGVFVSSDVGAVEKWALSVYSEFEAAKGDLAGGVSIGAAMLTERHTTPEQLRADAAAALQTAVESGVCTILE